MNTARWFGTAAAQVAAGLTPLELDVFAGRPTDVAAEPVWRAAVLRLRVGTALVTRPAPGTPADAGAVAALLTEIDGLLGEVKGLLADAPPAVKSALEGIRNALVKEAVDFSEACHQVEAAIVPAKAEVARAAPAVKFLSVRAGEDELEAGERKRGRAVWVLLVVAVLGAGGFHGYRWWKLQSAVAQLKTYPGQPDGMMLLPAPPGATTRELMPIKGPPDRAQVEQFKAQQKLLGKVVTETPAGGLRISPEPAETPDKNKRSTP